jgi:hypothetical protein
MFSRKSAARRRRRERQRIVRNLVGFVSETVVECDKQDEAADSTAQLRENKETMHDLSAKQVRNEEVIQLKIDLLRGEEEGHDNRGCGRGRGRGCGRVGNIDSESDRSYCYSAHATQKQKQKQPVSVPSPPAVPTNDLADMIKALTMSVQTLQQTVEHQQVQMNEAATRHHREIAEIKEGVDKLRQKREKKMDKGRDKRDTDTKSNTVS